ncbi:hypothetical protein K438DRAFT_2024498 [Mycena galopus ATCC 62051]|nr:hypothetical protein K438DRAFT_2024498 [Mycena galopus ATCC 62051]
MPNLEDRNAPVQFTVIGGGSKTNLVTNKADEMAAPGGFGMRKRKPKRTHQKVFLYPKHMSTHLSSVLKTMRPSVSAEEPGRFDRM